MVYVAPGDGEAIIGAGSGTIYKILGEMTGGVYSVVESTIMPGVLQPPHTHSREDHLFIITEGTVGVRIGDTEVDAEAGSYVFMPRDVPHAFWNSGDVEAKMIQINEPPEFETFFKDFYVLTKDGITDPKPLMDLMDQY